MKINFSWGRLSLHRAVNSLEWWLKRKIIVETLKRKIMLETTDIVASRSRYPTKIKKYQDNGNSLLYTYETWRDSN